MEADGGSRGNPGPAGYGALLRDAASGDVVAEAAEAIGVASNNVAEYRGLIAGLELHRDHTPEASLEVRMDSKLVIEQMAGRWKVKHPNMRPLALQAQRLAPSGTVWTWVPRERNKDADRLANLAMDAAARGEVYDLHATGTTAGPIDRSPGNGDPAGVVGTQDRPGDPTPDAMEQPTAGSRREPVKERAVKDDWAEHLGIATTVILLRHGVTRHTGERRFSGSGGDDPGLTDEGWEQARRSARLLAAEDVDAVVASPLQRTRDTAQPLAEALGLPVEIDDDFREMAFGAWDTLTLGHVRQRWPQELEKWMTSFDQAPPGGESMLDVQQRVERALSRTTASYAGKTVVVVSHLNPIKLAVRYCLGAPIESLHRMQLAPGSLTTLSFYDSGASELRQFSAVP